MMRASRPNRFALSALFLLLPGAVSWSSCQSTSSPASTGGNDATPTFGYEIVKTYPHSAEAYTQGLEYHDGQLLEGTGREGESSLRLVELETGKVVDKVDLPSPYFGEGITRLNGKIYQLTWQHEIGFIYDAATLSRIGQFNYDGEGWGLTNDGKSLILSDGTNQIRFIDPGSFQVTRTIAVRDDSRPVGALNELEYFNGEIYANIWHRDVIAVINPATGKVKAWIDLKGLLGPAAVRDEEAVLNGIAYDAAGQRLFVTGKLWPKLFEIRVKR